MSRIADPFDKPISESFDTGRWLFTLRVLPIGRVLSKALVGVVNNVDSLVGEEEREDFVAVSVSAISVQQVDVHWLAEEYAFAKTAVNLQYLV